MAAENSDEFRGKTVEAAIAAGLAVLGLSRDAAEVEVVRPGSRGVLGIGAEDAIVRIRRAGSPQREARPSVESIPPAAEPARPIGPEAPPVRVDKGRAPKQVPPAAPGDAPSEPRQSPAKAGAAINDRDLAVAEQGRDVLQGLLEHMNLRAEIMILPQSDAEADEEERVPVLNIVGDDLGVLIGRQNEVLSSLELVARLMVNQKTRSRSSFVVDVNGYRAKRAESLRKLALRMAEQATQAGRTMVLEPMPPAERRIIHLALRDHPSVTTQSVGEGEHRKVTVIPRKG